MSTNQPQHLALIMDGNGRWAQARGQSRFWGHKKGADVAQTIVEGCVKHTQVKYLTLYAFSTENWARPKEEVDFLFRLLDTHLEKKSRTLIENNVIVKTIGDLTPLPHSLCKRIAFLKEKTKDNTGLVLTLGLNYGGKQEIVSKIKEHLKDHSPEDLTLETVNTLMNDNGNPDPDFIIRTSGEMRLSNFMTWQAAYSELYFTETLWPDFTFEELQKTLNIYAQRQRRFGALDETSEDEATTPPTANQAGL